MRQIQPANNPDRPPGETTGLVFDIQRCSIQDGPGIRTTVFLKGCPLRCAWCHNPESASPIPQVSFDAAKCVECFRCLDVCPTSAHVRSLEGDHGFDYERCIACGDCVEVCVGNAIRVIGERMSVADVMAVVLRDRAYYVRGNGGMTLSGGEPTAQFEFSLRLLKAARGEGIHTCVETTGAASWQTISELALWTDLFLFDYKITDPTKHQAFVGCNNLPLLRNLDRLIHGGAKVVLRCPVIPGINDDEGHFRGIAAMSEKYPELVGVEIMAYHNLGVSKSEKLGLANPLADIEVPTAELQGRWLTRLHELGCEVAKLG